MAEESWAYEKDDGISFPARPPVEVRADGTTVEHVPGSAEDIQGKVERLGILDEGQRYVLRLSDIVVLFAAISRQKEDKARKILERAGLRDSLADLLNDEHSKG